MLGLPASVDGQEEIRQYGGTLTIGRSWLGDNTDTSINGGAATHLISLVNEKLGIVDWGIDRNVDDLKSYYHPISALKGALVESWEQPDPLTYIFQVRRGVHWHDKAPMNGRELTADDVEYNFHRYLGLGNGFTEFSYHIGELTNLVESVTAIDGWTVVFRLNRPDLSALRNIIDGRVAWIYPPEVIEKYGDIDDWRTLVGTGPFELTDLIEGTKATWTRFPDYWGSDETYPMNRIPYVDEVKAIIIPDESTRLSAIRTGSIDFLGTVGNSQLRSIEQIVSLRRTNPELNISEFAFRSENSFAVTINQPPFDDIRVRRALQMALNLEEINQNYFKHYGEWQPWGLIGRAMNGYNNPYKEWPEEIKQYYSYEPENAEKLLDEAGYQRGADGIRFKTVLSTNADWLDIGYRKIVADYWSRIGVNIEINAISNEQYFDYVQEKNIEGLIDFVSIGADYADLNQLKSGHTTGFYNPGGISDLEYDKLVDAVFTATTHEDQMERAKEADLYATWKHWFIWGPRVPMFQVSQPWVRGYNGEVSLGELNFASILARLWIDQDLKEGMRF